MISKAFEKLVIGAYDRARTAFSGTKESAGQRLFIGEAADPYDFRIKRPVYLDPNQHIYIVGGSGMGKTKHLESLLVQDVAAGRGFANLDFHGDASRSLLHHLASSRGLLGELSHRLVLIQPSDPAYAVGFNPLSSSGRASYGTALGLLQIVRRLWGADVLGTRTEELTRNLFAPLSEAGESLDMAEIFLTVRSFRDQILERVRNSEVRRYWKERYDPLSEKMQAVYREAVLNKFSAFLADPNILSMVGQKESAINLRRIMDEAGWLTIDLNKGELKANAYLLGAFFLAKLTDAGFSRTGISETERRPFYLYADEFQNVASESFVEVLTEARKYKLFFRLAHQHLTQLDWDLRAAIFGNVGAIFGFAVGHQDAVALAPELDPRQPQRWQRILGELRVGEAVLKQKGQPPVIVKIRQVITPHLSNSEIEALKALSHRRYARPKSEVLQEIENRREAFTHSRYPEKEPDNGNDGGNGGQKEW
jgi:hypothetical protein